MNVSPDAAYNDPSIRSTERIDRSIKSNRRNGGETISQDAARSTKAILFACATNLFFSSYKIFTRTHPPHNHTAGTEIIAFSAGSIQERMKSCEMDHTFI